MTNKLPVHITYLWYFNSVQWFSRYFTLNMGWNIKFQISKLDLDLELDFSVIPNCVLIHPLFRQSALLELYSENRQNAGNILSYTHPVWMIIKSWYRQCLHAHIVFAVSLWARLRWQTEWELLYCSWPARPGGKRGSITDCLPLLTHT